MRIRKLILTDSDNQKGLLAFLSWGQTDVTDVEPLQYQLFFAFLSTQPPAIMSKFLVAGFNPVEAIPKIIGEWHGQCRVFGEIFFL